MGSVSRGPALALFPSWPPTGGMDNQLLNARRKHMLNIPNQTQAAAAPAGRMNSVGTRRTDQGGAKVMQIQLKEVAIVVSVLLVIGGLVGGYWLYTQQEESYGGGAIIFSKDAKPAVTLNVQPAVTGPAANGVAASTTIPGLVPTSKTTDSIH